MPVLGQGDKKSSADGDWTGICHFIPFMLFNTYWLEILCDYPVPWVRCLMLEARDFIYI